MTPAQPSSAKINAIFQSMNDSGTHSPGNLNLVPFVLLVVALVMAYFAITQWHRQRSKPKPLRSHRKLLSEAARSASVSKRQMRRLTSLASEAGLSSPLVALICPSAIGRMAGHIRDEGQRAALRALAEGLVRQERRAAATAAKSR